MKFRTEINVEAVLPAIRLNSRVCLAGSCFANEVGNILKNNKINTLINPFGTLFNPISLFDALVRSLNLQRFPPHFEVVQQGVWSHYALHSEMSALSREALQQNVHDALHHTHDFLGEKTADNFLIITLGTAWAYALKSSGEIVANCHKHPAALFEKRLLSVAEIVAAFQPLHDLLPKNWQIVLTVSPVRHVKDTLPLNSVSKAVLRLAAHELTTQHHRVHYFPAYELLLDDLRDYRFYADDLLHPSPQAVQYIFEQFQAAYFAADTQDFVRRWQKIQQKLAHRPFHAESEAHQQFLRNTLQALQNLNQEVDVSPEIEALRGRLLK